jgi:hypothetical protein
MNPQDVAGKASIDNRSVQLNTNPPQQQPAVPTSSDSKGKQTTKNE